MVLTRSEAKDALAHVIKNVFKLPDDNPLSKAFAKDGITDIHDLLIMSDGEVDSLVYDDENQVETVLPRSYKFMLWIIKQYYIYQQSQGSPIGDDWTSLTSDEYNEFRTSMALIAPLVAIGTPNVSSSSITSTSSRTQDPIADFKKGIKWDATLFTLFKDEMQWDAWQQNTLAQARAQGVEDVLDVNYSPSSPEEQALFLEKQKYMYAVFVQTLLTDQGKALVRQYEASSDAQGVFKALLEHATQSTKASLEQSELLQYITSAKIGEGFEGSAHKFISSLA